MYIFANFISETYKFSFNFNLILFYLIFEAICFPLLNKVKIYNNMLYVTKSNTYTHTNIYILLYNQSYYANKNGQNTRISRKPNKNNKQFLAWFLIYVN